ncbi:MAG: YifB family Mg chelatase-like AAA ATPase [Intrasporangium sp.]|uniref:YifB family Mg chelatase-like AAA ATPase n=1 Tax=Intrasporangium sp. TaxID=1925024 RepID=UPI0026491B21|nr:YifB family Mg chelatase-like AAA ATPase [Intrasporangium sp.]MDN5794998.1 YifB family Mg chelatase-like AAA ATPase [Intrasporangium sp.]
MSGLGRTRSVGLRGVAGFLVEVEAHVAAGLPAFVISGLGDSAVAQSPGRIRAAASAIGIEASQRRVTVNLSPAGLRKVGPGFDLATFVAVAAAMRVVAQRVVGQVVHIGELGLDGTVRPVPGVLPAVRAAALAGVRHVVVPVENAAEARLVSSVRVHPVATVAELVGRYRTLDRGGVVPEVATPEGRAAGDVERSLDLSEVLGQAEAKLALEVAAAGGHHLLLAGPPGAGKTMLAERLPSILPSLDEEQSMEVTAIHSVLGALGSDACLIRRPPFVAPHHGASTAAVIGGGSGHVRPGAITQAHRGILFLDETPEFSKAVLQALRTPIERGTVTIARAQESVTFPARFQLVLAANPCPCGNGWGKGLDCTCSPLMRRNYFAKISGPLLDRVDLQVHVQPPGLALAAQPTGETSEVVAARVGAARQVQHERWVDVLGGAGGLNAAVPGSFLRRSPWRLPGTDAVSLDRALERGSVSLRGYDRTLRVAWTIADLTGQQRPRRDTVEMALSLRTQTAVAA